MNFFRKRSSAYFCRGGVTPRYPRHFDTTHSLIRSSGAAAMCPPQLLSRVHDKCHRRKENPLARATQDHIIIKLEWSVCALTLSDRVEAHLLVSPTQAASWRSANRLFDAFANSPFGLGKEILCRISYLVTAELGRRQTSSFRYRGQLNCHKDIKLLNAGRDAGGSRTFHFHAVAIF